MKIRHILSIGILMLATACTEDARQARGFSLPEGDIESGRLVFIEMRCNSCHLVDDIAQSSVDQTPELSIKLGGEVRSIKTYGDLVTSIINPSHRIAYKFGEGSARAVNGESRMQNYNYVMTVQELVDLVTFLQPQYELQPYPRTDYYPYYPRH